MAYSHSGWQHPFREIYRAQSSFTSIFIISKSACIRRGHVSGPGPRGYSIPPQTIAGVGERDSPPEEGVPSGQVSMVEEAVG